MVNSKEYKYYIVGAGGFGREVLNIFIDLDMENNVLGFLEENCRRRGELINGKPVDDLSILEKIPEREKENIRLVCAIGNPIRKRVIEYTKELGYKYETIIHPSVIMSRWVDIGEGVIICAGNILTNQISIGDHTIINLSSTIGHDVTIGKYVTISPGVNISGRVSIGDQTYIGTNASIIPKIKIGKKCLIGAGAVVTKDIPDNTLAVGVPAKPIRIIKDEEWVNLV